MAEAADKPGQVTITDVLGIGASVTAVCSLAVNVAVMAFISMPLWIWFVI